MGTTITLGQKVRDRVTGLVGTATNRCERLHGSTTIGVECQVAADGKPVDLLWFEEGRLEQMPQS